MSDTCTWHLAWILDPGLVSDTWILEYSNPGLTPPLTHYHLPPQLRMLEVHSSGHTQLAPKERGKAGRKTPACLHLSTAHRLTPRLGPPPLPPSRHRVSLVYTRVSGRETPPPGR